MCFEKKVKGKKVPRPNIAEKDIICYKRIGLDGYGQYYNLDIDNLPEIWKKGFHYYETTPFKGAVVNTWNNRLYIEGNAFHSYVDKPTFNLGGYKIIELIIPKGAKYYTNDYEYVSSQIIYK